MRWRHRSTDHLALWVAATFQMIRLVLEIVRDGLL